MSPRSMLPAEYRRHREVCGTQQSVADALGVDRVTISRRETGDLPITPEAALAIHTLRDLSRMQTIYHATAAGEPGEAKFGVFLDHSGPGTVAVIVVGGLFLFNSDIGRDAVLNQIAAEKLPGVRTQFIRFVAVPNWEHREPNGRQFTIHHDLKAHVKKRPLLARGDPVLSTELRAGQVRLFTQFDDGKPLAPEETLDLLRKAGIR